MQVNLSLKTLVAAYHGIASKLMSHRFAVHCFDGHEKEVAQFHVEETQHLLNEVAAELRKFSPEDLEEMGVSNVLH